MGNANSSDEEAEPAVIITPAKTAKHRQSLDSEPKSKTQTQKTRQQPQHVDDDTGSDNSDESFDLTPGKLATRASQRLSGQEESIGKKTKKKPSDKSKRNKIPNEPPSPPPSSVQLSNMPRSHVLPPPDFPPEDGSSPMDDPDSEFTELAELLTAYRLGKYLKKFTQKGITSVRQLTMCSDNFLTHKMHMGHPDLRLVRAAIASVDPTAPPPPPPLQETKEGDEERGEPEARYELISECEKGKSRKTGETELSACEVYSQSWGCGARLKCAQWLSQNKKEMVAGFTTSLTVIPTALAFSFLANMNATEGLMGTWIIMLVLAVAGGCPGMVYCNAGAVAVVLVDLVDKEGSEYVFYAFMLSGIVTAVLGYFKVARLLRMLPASVMVGFVNGLAIVIFFAQLKNFQIHESYDDQDDDHRRLNSFEVLEHDPKWLSGKELIYTLLNVVMTMIAMLSIPFTFPQVPGALAGMIISLIVEWALVRPLFGSRTNTVGDVAKVSPGIPMPVWMNNDYDMPPLNMHTFNAILPTALTISAVGLVESLMTVRFVSNKSKIYANSDQEAIMLGVGNLIVGAFGGQGGCSEIGLTLINLNSGGSNRTSSFTAAVCTLIIMYAAADGINAVPVGGLVGIMFVVVIHCFDFGSLKTVSASLMPKKWRESLKIGHRYKINRVDAVVIVAVTVITPFFDLAIAVAAGCLIAMCGFTWETADRLAVEVKTYPNKKNDNVKVYVVTGQIYYASIDKFISCFDVEGDPEVVEVELHAGDLCDYSALQAINGLGDEYRKVGKILRLRKLRLKSVKMMHKGQGLLHAFGGADNDLRDCLHGENALHTDQFDEEVFEVAEAGGQMHLEIEGYH